jgi:uncharacterized membrane protein YedE/YeeE
VVAGVTNIALGLVAVVAGLSGRFVLPGTSSGSALVVVGAVVVGVGIVQLAKRVR